MPNRGNDDTLTDQCITLIREQHVMTLGTSSSDGTWSAPVYYLYENKSFYFFSNPNSRHIREAFESDGHCAVSIFEDSDRFDQIKGLQMTGKIIKADKTSAIRTAILYAKRFKINPNSKDCLAFIQQKFRASFYRFVPEKLLYMDNSVGFGTRKEINL